MSLASRLYELLPAIHRIRDLAQGRPLEELFQVLGEPVSFLEDNLEQLYDDQFIETCAEWVSPYIGDLVGYRSLHGVAPGIGSPRAEVAHTIEYRRRKGTASMLEQLARDVTGWDARVVEFFEWVGWNQYVNHTRITPPRGGTLGLRDHEACALVRHASGAFDSSAHTIDVRRIPTRAGRYGVPNIGLFLWRLHAYPIRHADARKIAKGRFTFSPLGFDAPLFNVPQVEEEITHLAEEVNVPGVIRRRALFDELESHRVAHLAGTAHTSRYVGSEPVLGVEIDGVRVPAEEIAVCNLEAWQPAPTKRTYKLPDGTKADQQISVAIDPQLGRVTLRAGHAAKQVAVNYAYGFSHEMGAGPYDRLESVAPSLLGVDFQIAVSRDVPPMAGEVCATVGEAIDAWNDRVAAAEQPPAGIIAILDSRTYQENLTGARRIRIPAGSRLLIAAGDWPEEPVAGLPGVTRRVMGHLSPENIRPHLRGDIAVVGMPQTGDLAPGTLILNGLLIEGDVTVLSGNLGKLELVHSTVLPAAKSMVVRAGATRDTRNDALTISIDRSICGAITCPPIPGAVRISNSILTSGIDADDAALVLSAPGADVSVEASTVFGSMTSKSLQGSNSIFTGRVEAARRQVGCIRYSFLPLESVVPRRYRCQPDLELSRRIDESERSTGVPLSAADRATLLAGTVAEIRPVFTATRYGTPSFAQLAERCSMTLRTGADDESEMGAFHQLYGPQREANLRVRLDEYLRVGLEAGLFYVS